MELLFLFYESEQGGGLVEYTLIIAFIALAAVAAVTTLGTKVSNTINTVTPAL